MSGGRKALRRHPLSAGPTRADRKRARRPRLPGDSPHRAGKSLCYQLPALFLVCWRST